MNKAFDKISEVLGGPMSKVSEQKHLRSIRDGVVGAIPFIIVGSVFLLIAMIPLPEGSGLALWQKANQATILIPYRLTFNAMALYVSFGVGYHLAERYKISALSGGLISVCGFLVSLAPTLFNPANIITTTLVGNDATAYKVMAKEGLYMPIANFASKGIFSAIIIAIIAVEILRLCYKYHITIKLPEQVPASVARSFEAIVPVAFVVCIFSIISILGGINLETIIGTLVDPLIKVGDNLAGGLVVVFINSFFWSFGIHGSAIMDPITQPLWLSMLGENTDAHTAGLQMTHLMPQPFYQFFVYIGGSGAVLGLVIATLIVAKSGYGKSISKATLIPSIFNINEPIIFGFPVMLNPILIIPFIITPIVLLLISWVATALGLVGIAFIQPPWTLPAPLGAFFATGDWRAIILSLINIAIATVIYLPFAKTYDTQLQKEENNNQIAE
ncbi:MAG: PTS transporter subunit EIIC [Bifidobacteriaceae bacterium]|jgi:PTS system cellobiose-specific IIC component|nr:PTS transporter subunit EIIC [Bifidobacteriaceae bacterium]